MALSTYSDLLTSVGNWLNDTGLADHIPDFIALTEAELNRRLRTDEMEARTTLTVDAEYEDLPADFAGMRTVHLEGSPDYPLEQMARNHMLAQFSGRATGRPQVYAIVGTQLQFAPIPADSYSVEITYWQTLPALTVDAPTNWLLTAHPDVYLIGCLMQAELFGWNDNRLPLLKARHEEIIGQIETQARKKQWGAAPIYPRMPVIQARGAHI